MQRRILVLFLLALTLCLFSCFNNKTIEIKPSQNLDIAPDLTWALVVVPLASFRQDCSFESEVISYSRSGEIFQILGSRVVKTKIHDVLASSASRNKREDLSIAWYKTKNGWIDHSQVKIYDTRLKAENSAHYYRGE